VSTSGYYKREVIGNKTILINEQYRKAELTVKIVAGIGTPAGRTDRRGSPLTCGLPAIKSRRGTVAEMMADRLRTELITEAVMVHTKGFRSTGHASQNRRKSIAVGSVAGTMSASGFPRPADLRRIRL
jgi:hypothetical protein